MATSIEYDEHFYRVLAAVYRYSREVAVIDYPKNPKRSVDMVVELGERGRRVLIKCMPDASQISRREALELSKLALSLGASALIVAERMGGVRLESGVVYEKYGINVVNAETLEDVLSYKREVYVMMQKDLFKVRISGETLREKRVEKGYSLGDVASMLGVSRKAVYEYERGVIEPTVDRAERLVSIFGEEILEPIDIFNSPKKLLEGEEESSGFDVPEEGIMYRVMSRLGFKVAHAKRTSIDLGASRRGDYRVLVVTRRRRESSYSLLERIVRSKRFSEVMDSEMLIVVPKDSEEARVLRSERLEPMSIREAVERLSSIGDS